MVIKNLTNKEQSLVSDVLNNYICTVLFCVLWLIKYRHLLDARLYGLKDYWFFSQVHLGSFLLLIVFSIST